MRQIRYDNEDSDNRELKGFMVMVKAEPEYREGPEAGDNFRKLATALFQATKNGRKRKEKRQPKKATSRKSSGSGKD